MTLIWTEGLKHSNFSSSSLTFTLYSLAAYKISYFTMLGLLGKGCFLLCGTARCVCMCFIEFFCHFLFLIARRKTRFCRNYSNISILNTAFSWDKCIISLLIFPQCHFFFPFPSVQAKLQKVTTSNS